MDLERKISNRIESSCFRDLPAVPIGAAGCADGKTTIGVVSTGANEIGIAGNGDGDGNG